MFYGVVPILGKVGGLVFFISQCCVVVGGGGSGQVRGEWREGTQRCPVLCQGNGD